MLTHQETFESNYETRKVALEDALRVDYNGDSDGAAIVKNAELFLEFLTKENTND